MTEALDRPARARAERDMAFDGVRIVVSPRPGTLVHFDGLVTYKEHDPATIEPSEAFLHLPNDVARAMYEALAEHYGHDVVNARQLRRDYDAERGRVDKMITALIAGPRVIGVPEQLACTCGSAAAGNPDHRTDCPRYR